jgi:hypothetical protein
MHAALAISLRSDTLQLETLNIDGLSTFGFQVILSSLGNAMSSLKELVLTNGQCFLDIDESIDDFATSLEQSSPNLELFTLSFDQASSSSVYKLFNALATKNLKKLSLASQDRLVYLNDPSPVERFVAANRDLELFGVRNFHMNDMSGVFRAMENHANLKEMGLFQMLKSAHNAQALGRLLAQNRVPLEKLDVCNFGDENRHEALVPALLEGLCNSTTLKTIHFYLNEISSDDLAALAIVVEENSHIRSLRVSQQFKRQSPQDGNDQSLARFGHALMRNQSLTSLCLMWDQDVSQAVTRALLDGAKVNSTLKWTEIQWLPPKDKAELDFYIHLNCGAKQALHVPLNLMSFAFVRADQCRRSARVRWHIPREPELYTSEEFMVRLLSGIGRRGQRQQLDPPSELYFFVRERADLFQEAGMVARRRGLVNRP